MVFRKNKEPRISPGPGRLLHQFFEDDCAGKELAQKLFVLVPLKDALDFFDEIFFSTIHCVFLLASHHGLLSIPAPRLCIAQFHYSTLILSNTSMFGYKKQKSLPT